MLNVLKLGHAEFQVRDLDWMAEFYKNVIGLTETGREKDPRPIMTSRVPRQSKILNLPY